MKGPSILCFLGLPMDSQVLVVGGELQEWKTYFANVKMCEDVEDIPGNGLKYDLIFFYFNPIRKFEEDIVRLKKNLSYLGYAFIFVENRFEFASFRHLGPKAIYQLFTGRRHGYKTYKKILRKNFAVINCYLPSPDLESPDELHSIDSVNLDIKRGNSWLSYFFFVLGVQKYTHYGFVFICGNTISIEDSCFIDFLRNELVLRGEVSGGAIGISRFDVRLRGATLLFLYYKERGHRYIARLVDDENISHIVRKNCKFIAWLRNECDLPIQLERRLPRILVEKNYKGVAIFLETMLPGNLAWKVVNKQNKYAIHEEALKFIYELNCHTQKRVIITEAVWAELFDEDVHRISGCTCLDSAEIEQLFHSIEQVHKNLIGRKFDLVVTHGDYGYGNLLVESVSGKLLGVIDWDTGRKRDLPWLDIINLEIQRARNVLVKLSDAVRFILGRIENSGSVVSYEPYEQKFMASPTLQKVLLHASIIRYLSRAIQYEDLFLQEKSDFVEACLCMISCYDHG